MAHHAPTTAQRRELTSRGLSSRAAARAAASGVDHEAYLTLYDTWRSTYPNAGPLIFEDVLIPDTLYLIDRGFTLTQLHDVLTRHSRYGIPTRALLDYSDNELSPEQAVAALDLRLNAIDARWYVRAGINLTQLAQANIGYEHDHSTWSIAAAQIPLSTEDLAWILTRIPAHYEAPDMTYVLAEHDSAWVRRTSTWLATIGHTRRPSVAAARTAEGQPWQDTFIVLAQEGNDPALAARLAQAVEKEHSIPQAAPLNDANPAHRTTRVTRRRHPDDRQISIS